MLHADEPLTPGQRRLTLALRGSVLKSRRSVYVPCCLCWMPAAAARGSLCVYTTINRATLYNLYVQNKSPQTFIKNNYVQMSPVKQAILLINKHDVMRVVGLRRGHFQMTPLL